MIEAANIHGGKWLAIEDPTSGRLTYKRLLAGDAHSRRQTDAAGAEGRPLGVMLPTSNGAAVTVLALLSGGRVPAMINFTAGAANVLGACRAAEIDTILTAHAFVEKAQTREAHRRDREALAHRLSGGHSQDCQLRRQAARRATREEAAGRAQARRLGGDPVHFRHGRHAEGRRAFHRNVLANVAQAEARIDFGRDDLLFMALPAFHSFGFMGGIVLPLISGVPTFLYPSPLHYRTVPELVYGICATYMFGTDTFLAGYARMANAYDFRSLRYIVAGAEPIKESTRRIYLENSACASSRATA